MTKAYTLKIRGGVEVDSYGKKAGKGALIQEELSATLGVSQDQYLFQPITFEPGIASREGGHIYEGVSGTLRAKPGDNQMAVAFARRTSEVRIQSKDISPTLESAKGEGGGNIPMVAYGIDRYNQAVMEGIAPTLKTPSGGDDIHCVMVENHPADSRCKIDDSGTCQTLTSRMGTSGNNVPMVMQPVICLEGNGARPSHHGNGYIESDKMYTLNTVDRHSVCYTVDMGGGKSACIVDKNLSPTLTCTHYGEPAVCYPKKAKLMYWDGSQVVGTLTAHNAGGNQRMPDKENFTCVLEPIIKSEVMSLETFHCNSEVEKIPPLKARDYKDPLVIAIDRAAFNQGENAQFQFQVDLGGVAQTVVARGPGAVCYEKISDEEERQKKCKNKNIS